MVSSMSLARASAPRPAALQGLDAGLAVAGSVRQPCRWRTRGARVLFATSTWAQPSPGRGADAPLGHAALDVLGSAPCRVPTPRCSR